MGTADLHIHTRHGDGMASVLEVLDHVEHHSQLDVVAITEHDTLRAADEAREHHARGAYRFEVISGIEVTTLDGHLLALFVDEPISSFRRMEPTLEAIHRGGGIAVAPHPLSWLTRSVSARVFERVARARGNDGVYFDAIEEANQSPAGRISSARATRLNRERLHLAAVGSSDAHFLASIGSARTRFDGATAADVRRAIEQKVTEPEAGHRPSLSQLGYRNVAYQQFRGLMATPRAMGWVPTIRSFARSRLYGSAHAGHPGTPSRGDAPPAVASPDTPATPREGPVG